MSHTAYSGGPLELRDAAAASVTDPVVQKRELKRLGFTHGHARVWHAGDAYASVLVMRVKSASAARALVAFVAAQAKDYAGTFTFAVPDLPGAVGFQIAGSRPGAGGTLYCYTVWYQLEDYAFNVNQCAPFHDSTVSVVALAQRQFAVPLRR